MHRSPTSRAPAAAGGSGAASDAALPPCRPPAQAAGVAASFSNSREVLEALQQGVVLVDRSHWGRIRIAGEGRTSFMHNQSTNDFKALAPGQGCDTVRARTARARRPPRTAPPPPTPRRPRGATRPTPAV